MSSRGVSDTTMVSNALQYAVDNTYLYQEVVHITLKLCLKSQTVQFMNALCFCIAWYHMTQVCIEVHLIDILKVEPRVERPDGQVQVRQLEICHSRADVPLVGVDTKSGAAQAVLVQRGTVHGNGEALVEDHRECIRLDLWEMWELHLLQRLGLVLCSGSLWWTR